MQVKISTIQPFDASLGTTITFQWNGDIIQKARCIIKDNETGQTVYDQTQDTMKQRFYVSDDSGLENGKYYVAYITVFNTDGVESDIQTIGMPFYCFKTPTFRLSLNNGDTIKTSNCNVSANYSQENGEEINYCKFILYSYTDVELSASEIIYDESNMSHVFTGLENTTQYYVRAVGETVNKIPLDTGKIMIITSYEQAAVFSVTEANNLPAIGGIELKSNIVSADAHITGDYSYLDGGGVDLSSASALYDGGFDVTGDFSMYFNLRDSVLNESVITFKDSNNFVCKVFLRRGRYEGQPEKYYYELSASNGAMTSVVLSNYFEVNDVKLYIFRQSNMYRIVAKGRD